MSSDFPEPPHSAPRWPLRYVTAYQRGSSILPSSTLFIGFVLLLILVVAVMGGIFFAEGNSVIGSLFMIVAAVLVLGLWRANRRIGV
jgi:positive regulator of sigma E activity